MSYWGQFKRLFQKPDLESENHFQTIAFSLARMREMDLFDSSRLVNYSGFRSSARAKAAVRLVLNSKWRNQLKPTASLSENAEALASYIKGLPLSLEEVRDISDFFWRSGIAGYGIPVAAFVKQETIIVAAMRSLAKGPDHFRQSLNSADRFLPGWYVVYSKRAGSEIVEKSLMCIQNIIKHERGGRERRLRIDARQGCLELTREAASNDLTLRAGTFVNFDTYSSLFLSPNAQQTMSILWDEIEPYLDEDIYVVDGDYLKNLTVEKREGRIIQGTFQTRDTVGQLRGFQLQGDLSKQLLESIGILAREKLSGLGGEDLEAVDRLMDAPTQRKMSGSFEGGLRKFVASPVAQGFDEFDHSI